MIPEVPDDLRSRHRLGERRRRSDRRVGFAVLFVITVAALGGSTGIWIGWRGAPELPGFDDGAAFIEGLAPDKRVATIDLVNPDLSTDFRGRRTGVALFPLVGNDEFGAGYVQVILGTGRDPGMLRDVAARTAEAGWEVHQDDPGFTATAHGLHLGVYPSDGAGERASSVEEYRLVSFELYRAEPRRVLPLALAGFLGGAVPAYGWLRLWSRLRGRYRDVALRCAVVAIVLLLPTTLFAVAGFAHRLTGLGAPGTAAHDNAILLRGIWPVTALGLAVLAVALATPLVAVADHRIRGRTASRPG